MITGVNHGSGFTQSNNQMLSTRRKASELTTKTSDHNKSRKHYEHKHNKSTPTRKNFLTEFTSWCYLRDEYSFIHSFIFVFVLPNISMSLDLLFCLLFAVVFLNLVLFFGCECVLHSVLRCNIKICLFAFPSITEQRQKNISLSVILRYESILSYQVKSYLRTGR